MSQCPTDQVLNEYALGSLSAEAAQELEEHLDSCERCRSETQRMAAAVGNSDQQVDPKLAVTQLRPTADTTNQNDSDTVSASSTNTSSSAFGGSYASDELSFLEPSDDPAYIGKLQHFQISRVIGRGGMGVVLEAFDPHLQRPVAIKVLSRQFQDNQSAIERFCREGRAAASVSHEHVVPMYQVARIEDGEIAFLVMQFIKGETLQARLEREAPMPPSEVARIAMQIAAGLSVAHEIGLVHRDIKPGNVLLEQTTDRVKLTDFGLARSTDDVKLTQTGMLIGTALYMSPEQAIGKTIDERSDLFSLGAVMYEMATGISAFEAPTAVGVIKQIMDQQPKAPRQVNPKIGKPLSDLIMQLLKKKPSDRPDSAGLVAKALASIVTEHGPISPLQVPSVASTTVRNLARRDTVASRILAWTGWGIAALMLGGMFLPMLLGHPPWLGSHKNEIPISVVWNSPTGPRDVTSKFPSIVLGDNPGTVWSISFSPDGEAIAAGVGDGSVRIWDIENQKVTRSFHAHDGNVWRVQFHPALDLIATAGDDAMVKLWDASTFELKFAWKADNSVRGLAFSPNQNVLVAGDRAGKLHVYDIETGEETDTHSQEGTVLGLDFSADGKSIVTVGSDKTVRVFDSATFDQRQSMTGHAGPIYNVAFAPDGPLIASVGWKSDIWVWNSETGENVLTLDGDGGDNWGVSFLGRNASHLVAGNQDGSTLLWRLSDGRHAATFHGHSAPVHNISLDRVRKRIATSSRDGTIRIWDTSALKELGE